MSPARLSPRRAPVAVKLFLTCWIVYGLHFATNVVREHYPAFSLAERGTLRVDRYVELHPDLFELEGRGGFINNNPGASLVGALPYALVRPAVDAVVEQVAERRAAREGSPKARYADPRPNRRRFFREVRERGLDVRFGLATLSIHALGMAPLTALSAVVVRSVLLRLGLGAGASLGLALLYAFGTPVFFRTAFLNHNLLVAHFALFGFALAFRADTAERRAGRLFGAGACAGALVLLDYSGVVPAACLGAYVLAKHRPREAPREALRAMLWMGAGAAGPIAVLLGYQAWAFGSPFLPAQHYMPDTHLSQRGWNGLAWPSPELLLRNLFDPRYGLFAFGPILLAGLAAPWLARRGRGVLRGPELALSLALPAALLVFTSANQYAWLQWNTGFRMLAPAVPFLFLCTAAVLVRLPRFLVLGLAAIAVAEQWCLAMVREDVVTSVSTTLSRGITLPWLTVLWKMGDQYLPLLQRTGPQGLPLVLAAGALVAFLWWPPRRPGAGAETPEAAEGRAWREEGA